MTKLKCLARVVALAAVCVCGMAAEGDAQPARDSVVRAALSQFSDGDLIRVALLRSPFVGRYMGTRGDTVFFGKPGEPPMAFRFNAVDSLWSADRATRRGATIGSLVGIAVLAAASTLRERDGDRSSLAVTAILGALGGGTVGGLIGAGFRRWSLVFPPDSR